jgi:superfamily I DNA/RNA helicase/mRNA-degrading endonuclease RelE of RelBE toxin-antitoxin system
MQFRIADTFTDSLTRLSGEEQKAVKTAAFDLQVNPAHPSLKLHKLDKAKDKRFWSVRVSSDIRLILHRSDDSLLLCYAAHHDDAYDWARRRKLETHPTTGAAQLVEIRETVVEIKVPRYVEVAQPALPKPSLFAALPDETLLRCGVPAEWLGDVRAANEDSLLALADHLPAEAAEALLNLATGTKPPLPPPAPETANPFEHPDAQRRFRTMANAEELERALAYPWEKWTLFLHPSQKQLVERDYSGAAKVAGSAGTGKTIVALHRTATLARQNREARVLLTTFSDTLASALRTKLRRLIHTEPRVAERIEVHAFDAIARHLYEVSLGKAELADRDLIRTLLSEAAASVPNHRFTPRFLLTEWVQIVDAWQLTTWEAYRDVVRLGRKTRLPENQRQILWTIFAKVHAALEARGMLTQAALHTRLAAHFTKVKSLPFEHIVVDEAQDLSVPQLRLLAALADSRPNSLLFAGDLGQRIFQQPFSWKALGVDVRGRSTTLRINYRTSHQIRTQADRLLDPVVSDVDGNREERNTTVSTFNGPPPEVRIAADEDEETAMVAAWIQARLQEGIVPHEIGIFVRSDQELPRAQTAALAAGAAFRVLDEHIETRPGQISLGTMHLAKGLEFKAVAAIACDDEIIPSQSRIETVTDDADLEEVYNTERHLLYVACTRARDHLLVTGVDPASEFLGDLDQRGLPA